MQKNNVSPTNKEMSWQSRAVTIIARGDRMSSYPFSSLGIREHKSGLSSECFNNSKVFSSIQSKSATDYQLAVASLIVDVLALLGNAAYSPRRWVRCTSWRQAMYATATFIQNQAVNFANLAHIPIR